MVQNQVAAFVRDGESLSVWVVLCVNDDMAYLAFANEHPRYLVFERLSVQLHSERRNNLFYGNGYAQRLGAC
jgi:hypothetical protein